MCLLGIPCVRENSLIPSLINVNWCVIGRNQDYLTLNLTFAINVMKLATIISIFPNTLKPYVVMACLEFA